MTTKTMMETVMTPQKVHINPTLLPKTVMGAKSPNPTLVIVITTSQMQF